MSYKTARELGISPEERKGLIALAAYLRKPEVVHLTDDVSVTFENSTKLAPVGFTMGITTGKLPDNYECGTAACIGGHLSLYLQGVDVLSDKPIALMSDEAVNADDYVGNREFNSPMSELFYPTDVEGSWLKIKPVTAAAAIENFLTAGEPNWVHALEVNDQESLLTKQDDED